MYDAESSAVSALCGLECGRHRFGKWHLPRLGAWEGDCALDRKERFRVMPGKTEGNL